MGALVVGTLFVFSRWFERSPPVPRRRATPQNSDCGSCRRRQRQCAPSAGDHFRCTGAVPGGATGVRVRARRHADAAADVTAFALDGPCSFLRSPRQQLVGPGPFSVYITRQVSGTELRSAAVRHGRRGRNENVATACSALDSVTQFAVDGHRRQPWRSAELPPDELSRQQLVPAWQPWRLGTHVIVAARRRSHVTSYVLIGIAAIVVGAVLVVAARRRSHLSFGRGGSRVPHA